MRSETPPRSLVRLGSRFDLTRRIGGGGFGEVYEAWDRERAMKIAIKALRRIEPAALYRFKKEFRSLADVEHPNLVRLYELLTFDDQWYLTMELVDGVDFFAWVRGAAAEAKSPHEIELQSTAVPSLLARESSGAGRTLPDDALARAFEEDAAAPTPLVTTTRFTPPSGELDVARLRRALAQLARGVAALHERGKIHRDLKPSNVLVTAEGVVRILDFGLVAAIDLAGKAATLEGAVGTPAYMAPEQIAGAPATAASDWYAIGTMLFEALTGRLPFQGPIAPVMFQKRLQEAPDPAPLAETAPADLLELTRELLRRWPSERPSGAAVLERLARGAQLSGQPVSTAPPAPIVERLSVPPDEQSFVGREDELDRLREAFDASLRGGVGLVHVRGPSGIGKTALVRKLLDELANRGDAIVVSGRCYERESVPYKAVDDLVDELMQMIARMPTADAREVVPDDAASLVRLFPVLARAAAFARAPELDPSIVNAREVRRRAFTAFRELLTRIAARKPLVLHLDDVHWGDLDSAMLMIELLRAPHPPRILFVASYRAEEAATSTFLRVLAADADDTADDSVAIDVGALPASQTEALARNLLRGASATDVERIARESGGAPLFVQALVRHLRASELESLPGGQIISLGEVLESRLDRLSEPARRVIELLAVAGHPLPEPVVRTAAGLTPERWTSALAELRTASLLRRRGAERKLETFHDRIREATLAALSPDASKNRHLALATTMEASGDPDPESLATHFVAAGEPGRAGHYARLAAERAAATLAFDRAAELYQLAVELAHESHRPGLQVALAAALAEAGRGQESADAYLVASRTATTRTALDLERCAAEQYLRAGHVDAGLDVLRRVLKASRFFFPTKPWQSLLLVVLGMLALRVRGLSYTPRSRASIAERDLERLTVCWSAAMGLANIDRIRGIAFLMRYLLMALRIGDATEVARGLALFSVSVAFRGGAHADRAAQIADRARVLAEEHGAPYAATTAVLASAIVALCQFRFRESRDLFLEADRYIRERCTGIVSFELSNVQLYLFNALLFRGEFAEVARLAPAYMQESERRGDRYAAGTVRTVTMPMIHLCADRPEEARNESREAIRLWSREGFHIQHCYDLFTQIMVALYTGDGTLALAHADSRWRALERSFLLRAQHTRIYAYTLRGRAAVAATAASGGSRRLLARARHDARRLHREAGAYPRACALSIEAAVAQVEGSRFRALELLGAADAAYDEADMPLFAAAMRYARGKMIGGEAGERLVAAAEATLRAQGIVNPERMVAMVAPCLG